MIRSMYSGISGMKNQQVKMDVIGNNIANISSVAFKGSRVTFKDALYQTMQGASGPTFSTGGVNPRQVGLGMSVSSIDRDVRQGTLQPTGRATDIAVQGNGYFMVSNGSETFYTRDGSFTLDKYGDLVTSGGFRVLGIDKTGNRGPINVPLEHPTVPPIKFGSGTPPKEVMAVKLYGFDGGDNVKSINFTNTAGGDQPITMTADGAMTINIGGYDKLTDLEKAIKNQMKKAEEMSATERDDPKNDNYKNLYTNMISKGIYGVSVTGDLADAQKTPPTIMDESKGAGGTGFKIEKIQLGSFSIGKDGKIQGIYGEDRFEVARLEISSFVNDAGLEGIGENLYRQSANSGEANRGFPGDDGFGTAEQGFLEMSNVDLANEFTEMIVTSRSYQANSRTITTSDEMLQELLNIKR
ncbi:MAG: flagellar hook-basal body complex protein [Clostridium sp.]